jgi:hypothetical protein
MNRFLKAIFVSFSLCSFFVFVKDNMIVMLFRKIFRYLPSELEPFLSQPGTCMYTSLANLVYTRNWGSYSDATTKEAATKPCEFLPSNNEFMYNLFTIQLISLQKQIIYVCTFLDISKSSLFAL